MTASILCLVLPCLVATYAISSHYELTDFTTFWNVGRQFHSGAALYQLHADYRPYYYPPSAALLLSPWSLLSLKSAQALFNVINVLLWAASCLLLFATALRGLTHRAQSVKAALIAIVGTIPFVLNTLHLVQVNLVVLFLIMLAVSVINKRRHEWMLGICLGLATALKAVPGAILLWLLIRGRKRAAAYGLVAVCLLCSVGVLYRGFHQGIRDYSDFFHTVVLPSQGYGYRVDIWNFSLHGAIARLLSYLNIAGAEATAVHGAQAALVIGMMLLALLARRYPVDVRDFGLALLVMLLMSPQTATSHLVLLLPVYYSSISCAFNPELRKG